MFMLKKILKKKLNKIIITVNLKETERELINVWYTLIAYGRNP